MQRPNQTPAQRQEQRQELWQPQHQEQSHARHREQRSPLKRTAIGRCARAGLVALAGVAGLVASGLAGVVAEVRVAAADPPVVWEVTEGIKAPESAYWDAEAGVLFLSQIGGGGGTAKDGDGWISKLSREGKVTPVTPEPLGNLDGVERDGAGGYVAFSHVCRLLGGGRPRRAQRHDEHRQNDERRYYCPLVRSPLNAVHRLCPSIERYTRLMPK